MIKEMIKSYFKVSKRQISIALILAILFSMPLFVIEANAEAEVTDSVTSVTVTKNKEKIEILATLTEKYLSSYKGDPVYLFEITPYQSVSSISGYEPVAQAKASSKMKFEVPVSAGTRSRISSGFILAQKNYGGGYTPLGTVLYISNPSIFADATYLYPETYSKKGLIITDSTDAEMLGTANTVITVPINEYFLGESGDNSLSFLYSGKTFYFDRNKITGLDTTIRSLSNSGVNIYLNIVLSDKSNCLFDGIHSLYYDNASENAKYYAINISNSEGNAYFEAIMKFLSARYSDDKRPYGFAGSYIIGYNVNSGSYNAMGERELTAYTESYASLFRTAYSTVKSSYSNAKLFLSVANNFTAPSPSPAEDVNPLTEYSAKSFITEFNKIISASGNIDWSVAINAYPSDRTNTSQWIDSLAENNLETPFITMANIDILCRFLSQTEFLFDDEVRRCIVSEFAAATPAVSETVDVTTAEKQQAAAFAYAYYKAASISYIDAVIYGSHIDAPEGSPAAGLWTCQPGTENTRNSKKYIYDIFKNIDVKEVSPLTDFALPILSITSFSDSIEGFASPTPSRNVIESVQTSVVDIEKGYRPVTLFDFTSGDTNGFNVAENTAVIELRRGEDAESSLLYAKFDQSVPYEFMGVDVRADSSFVIPDTKYITLRLMAEAPADVSSVTFMLRLYSGGKAEKTFFYEGTAQIEPGKWVDVTFDIGDFIKNTGNTVKTFKLWFKSTDEKAHDGDFGVYLHSVSTWRDKGLSVIAIILIVLLVIVLGFAGFIGYLFLKGYLRRRKIIMRRRKLAEFRALEKKRQEEKLRRTLRNMFPDETENDSGSSPSDTTEGR